QPWPRKQETLRLRRSQPLEAGPAHAPALVVGQLGLLPNDIRSPSSGLQRSQIGSNLAGGPSTGRHRTPASRSSNTRPLAMPAAARAPPAATPPRLQAA